MTSQTYELAEPDTRSVAAGRLAIAGGVALLVIAALHLITMSLHGMWGGWFAGDLRSAMPGDPALGAFWAGLGGFAVPVALLGVMIIRTARAGRRTSPVLGFGLLGWAALCAYLAGPGGFLTFAVPSLLLIMADLLERLRHHGFRR